MCDYSLHYVANRPAKVGDKLVTTRFRESSTRGFAAIGEPNVAVCLLPGTEIAFDREVDCDHGFGFLRNRKAYGKLARFRQINTDQPGLHRMRLSFPTARSCSSRGCAKVSTRPCCSCRLRASLTRRRSQRAFPLPTNWRGRFGLCADAREAANRLLVHGKLMGTDNDPIAALRSCEE